jgi:hypothetical protein
VPSPVRASQLPRSGLCLLLICAALAVSAAGAPPALSAGVKVGNSFNELTSGGSEPQTATTTTATTARTSTETSSGNSRTLILVAIGAAVVLLSGIGYVIVRDARRIAPATEGDLTETRSGHDAAARLAKRRAKAKAARRQRKRSR